MPLRYEDETIPISDAFTRQVRQALNNLRDKQGVTVRFIGYTDDAPLTGRDESIYGNSSVIVEGKGAARRIGHAGKSWDCRHRRLKATVAEHPTRLPPTKPRRDER